MNKLILKKNFNAAKQNMKNKKIIYGVLINNKIKLIN